MDVRIGVTYTAKELDVEIADDTDSAALVAEVDAAVSGSTPVLWLVDRKGRRFGVPTDKIAYIEIGTADSERRIGFGT